MNKVISNYALLSDGTTSIRLDAGVNDIYIESYVPRSAEISTKMFVDEAQDGGELLGATRRNVSEQMALAVKSATNDLVLEAVRQIEMLLMQAEQCQIAKAGAPVYLYYCPGYDSANPASEIYRTEILSGKVEWSEESITTRWGRKVARIGMIFTRRYYFEGNRTELPLWDPAAAAESTGGITIYNHSLNPDHFNYVRIDPDNVDGVLPSPIELHVTFNVRNHSMLYVFEGVGFPGVASLFPQHYFLEAEANGQYSNTVVDASCSGGEKCTLAFAGPDTISLTWAFDAAKLQFTAGRWFKIVGRMVGTIGADSWFSPYVTHVGSSVVQRSYGPTVSPQFHQLMDMGMLQVPPGAVGEIDLAGNITLGLKVERLAAGDVELDYIDLLPVDGGFALYQGGYRSSSTLVDDGKRCYFIDGSDLKSGGVSKIGRGLFVYPGRWVSLYFLGEDTYYAAYITQTFTVRAFYRPRRLTLGIRNPIVPVQED